MNKVFENMAFQGAGVRGIAYLGALQALNEKGCLNDNIKRVAGASAGAINAFVLALSRDYDEIAQIISTVDYEKISGPPFPTDGHGLLDKIKNLSLDIIDKIPGINKGDGKVKDLLISILYLNTYYGLHSKNYIRDWFRQQLKAKFGKENLTFAELAKQEGAIDLNISITDVFNKLPIVCNATNTPDLEIAVATTASMSIPIYFTPEEIEEKTFSSALRQWYKDNGYFWYGKFADGGTMNNYPIDVFSEGDGDVVPNTLGFVILGEKPKQPVNDSLVMYGGSALLCTLDAQYTLQMANSNYKDVTIELSDSGVGVVQFDIKPTDPLYIKCVSNAKAAALEQLNAMGA